MNSVNIILIFHYQCLLKLKCFKWSKCLIISHQQDSNAQVAYWTLLYPVRKRIFIIVFYVKKKGHIPAVSVAGQLGLETGWCLWEEEANFFCKQVRVSISLVLQYGVADYKVNKYRGEQEKITIIMRQILYVCTAYYRGIFVSTIPLKCF